MSNSSPVAFYANPLSLYSGKVRSYLRKSGIAYEERFANHPKFFAEIVPKIGRFVIPVVETTDGEIVQDTTEIIDHFEARTDRPSVYPSSPKQKIAALIMELFGDEGLLRTAMHYRWNFNEDNQKFISLEFGRIFNPVATDTEALEMAAAPMARMRGLLKPLGVNTDTIPVIEAGYLDLLAVLDAHFLKYPYLFGGKPSIGDFGLYAPLYAHLARDPAPGLIMKKNANRVWRWVERMTAADLDKPEFLGTPDMFLADDEIAETLMPILAFVAKDFGPEISALIQFLDNWLADNPDIQTGDKVISEAKKRTLGPISITVRGQEFTAMARHYTVWMLQRVQDAYDELTDTDQESVAEMLVTTGLMPLVATRCKRRIERVNYTEIWGQTTA